MTNATPLLLKIKPASAGLLVRLEDGSDMLAASGQAVPATSYYRRRLMDGDVVELTTEEVKALDASIAAFENGGVTRDSTPAEVPQEPATPKNK